MPSSYSAALTSLLPAPQVLAEGDGLLAPAALEFVFPQAINPQLQDAAQRCATTLSRIWSDTAAEPTSGSPIVIEIDCVDASAQAPELGGTESYRLVIPASGPVQIQAAAQWGVLHALTTLVQLGSSAQGLPCCEIRDEPRFAWRGLMLDPARHFLPLPSLLETLDGMALCKLNVLHLHLSDDQGFRFYSNKYPKLASAEHYSTAELRELVEFASARGIRVIPELDVPGHSTSWLAAYPEWGTERLANNSPASDRFGVHKGCLDPTNPDVLDAVVELFAELAEIFPDSYCHIGGDEVHPAWWQRSDSVAAYMLEHGLADPAALQAQFNSTLRERLGAIGRKVVAWDEVLHPGFDSYQHNSVVQGWRGATARDRALDAGHDCVDSSGYYLDLMYPADIHYGYDPGASEAARLAWEDELLADPRFAHVADGMRWTHQWRQAPKLELAGTPGQLLGAEACLWSELVDAATLSQRLWSRLPAVAERLWSTPENCDSTRIYSRLRNWLQQLPNWCAVDPRAAQLAGFRAAGLPDQWFAFVDLLEPVKWYARLLGEAALQARLQGSEMPQARPYQVHTALDRVVDHLSPESNSAVDLSHQLDSLGDESRQALWAGWKTMALLPECPRELQPLVEKLAALTHILDQVEQQQLSAATAITRIHAAQIVQPSGEYMLAVVWPVLAWLESGANSNPQSS